MKCPDLHMKGMFAETLRGFVQPIYRGPFAKPLGVLRVFAQLLEASYVGFAKPLGQTWITSDFYDFLLINWEAKAPLRGCRLVGRPE